MDKDWFLERMKERGVRQDDVGALMGRDRTIVSKILSGQITMELHHAIAFSKALSEPVGEVLRHAGATEDLGPVEPGERVPVKGFVQAGNWVESHELPPDEWMYIDSHDAYQQYPQVVGVMVQGDSMDRVFPPGTILIVCPIIDYEAEPESGDYVVVQRRCLEGLTEWTVKELRQIDGEIWLRPHSTNPRHQNIKLPNGEDEEAPSLEPDGRSIVEIRVWGVVVGFHHPTKPKAPSF